MNRGSIGRWLWGHDVFISYSRADGLAYASSLAYHLGQSQTSAYADVFGSEPGHVTPKGVIRALKNSRVLVVLCTPSAMRSSAVLDEIIQFPAGRPVVPICLGTDQAAVATWTGRLVGLAASCESDQAWATGLPSETVTRRVTESAGRWHQARRLQWTIASASIVLSVLAAAMAASTMSAKRLRAEVAASRDEVKNLSQQRALLHEEIANAAQKLAATQKSLTETTALFDKSVKDLRAAEMRTFEEQENSLLLASMQSHSGVTCIGGGFGTGPIAVPFWGGKSKLFWASEGMLDELAECMRTEGRLKVELISHSSTGDGNPQLQARRLQTVIDHLLAKGASRRQMVVSDEKANELLGLCTFSCVLIRRLL